MGTEIDVRLTNVLNSGTAQVEDRFEGTTLSIQHRGRTVIPAGSVMPRGRDGVEPATARSHREDNRQLRPGDDERAGVSHRGHGDAGQSKAKGSKGDGTHCDRRRRRRDSRRHLGGFKGALAGILIRRGGTIAATEGKEVNCRRVPVLRSGSTHS